MLKLKINQHWAKLEPGTSIQIVMTSPIFSESGSFSYPFTLPFQENRHIFLATATPEDDVKLKNLRLPFELYTDGWCVLQGIATVTSEKVDIENDRVEIELGAGTDSFDEAVEKIKLRDLDLSDTLIGYSDLQEEKYSQTYLTVYDYMPGDGSDDPYYYKKVPLKPTRYNVFRTQTNLSDIYPVSNFVNVPIIVNGQKDGKSEKAHPLVLSGYRALSSPCFFVLYILDKIIAQTGYRTASSSLLKIEDMKRLVVMNAKCVTNKQVIFNESTKETLTHQVGDGSQEIYYKYIERENCHHYASSENLPDIEAKEFITSLKNAFGVRYYTDEEGGLHFVLLRDIFKDNETIPFQVKNIRSITPLNSSFGGAKVEYKETKGDEYAYDEYNNVRVYDTYENMLTEWNGLTNEKDLDGEPVLESDVILKVIKETGNFYRTKVDKDKFNNPQIFEMAQFLPYEIEKDENTTASQDKISIAFSPIIPTTICTSGDDKFHTLAKFELPNETLYVNVPVDWKDKTATKLDAGEAKSYDKDFAENALKELLDTDLGFMVGVIRTTSKDGNTGEGYDIIDVNADGFNNNEWTTTVAANSATADSITDSGFIYDYNAGGEGTGTTIDQYISLKLWSGKQNFDATNATGFDNEGNIVKGKEAYNNNPTGLLPNRGLVPQFLQEYLTFLKEHKTIEVEGELNPVQLLNIPWTKWTTIDKYKGLLNEITLDISDNGISNVKIEHYI